MPRAVLRSVEACGEPNNPDARVDTTGALRGRRRRRRRALRPPEGAECIQGGVQSDTREGVGADLLSQRLNGKSPQEGCRDFTEPAVKRRFLTSGTSPEAIRQNRASVTDNSPLTARTIGTSGQAAYVAPSRPIASDITCSALPGDSELLLEELRNGKSSSEWPGTSNRSSRQSSIVKRLTFALNEMKEKLATERHLKEALVRVNKSSDEKVLELKREVLHWKRRYEYEVKNALGYGSTNKRSSAPQKKKAKSEPSSEQMPLWLYVTSRMRAFCLLQLNCQRKESDGKFRRDWDSCSIPFPLLDSKAPSPCHQDLIGDKEGPEDLGDWIVPFSDGRKGVPRCPMVRALQGGYLDKELSLLSFKTHLVASYGSEEVLRKEYTELETFKRIAKDVAEARFPEYKLKVSNAISTRKKDAVDGFFRELGYPVLNDISKKVHDYERKRAKAEEQILRAIDILLLTRKDESGTEWPIFNTYRLAPFGAISNIAEDVREGKPPSFVKDIESNEMTDILFRNNAARNAYISWSRCSGEGTSSVLDLARIDAWICTWLELVRNLLRRKENRKPGGSRNKDFNKRFKQLLPKALEEILSTCRLELEKVSPNELRKPFDLDARMECMEAGDVSAYDNAADYEIEVRPEVHKGDIYNRNGRRHTKAFNYPENDMDYVALKSSFFKSHICSWMGDIVDCYVGRCEHDEMEYAPITAKYLSRRVDSDDCGEVGEQISM